MTDREKVITALQLELEYPYSWECAAKCPYYGKTDCDCFAQVTKDAIELLKEQHRLIEQLKHELGVTRAAMNRCMDKEWLTKEEARTLKHMGISARCAVKGEEKRE